MNREEAERELSRIYADRRRENGEEMDRRLNQAAALDPAIPDLMRANSDMIRLHAMAALNAPEMLDTSLDELRASMRLRREEAAKRLKDIGLPADYLDPVYRCDICHDTGFVGDEVLSTCTCYRRELNGLMFGDGEGAAADGDSFESYDESVFPDAPTKEHPFSQRERSAAVRAACESYADELPRPKRRNLVLLGASGLGKSFLINCIHARALERGIDSLKISAYKMLTAMRACHVGDEAGQSEFQRMIDCELLLIDDFGTEPMFKNITVEYSFTLLNERMSAGKFTAIASNLKLNDLRERYGERIFSRLISERDSQLIRLAGQDIRLIKNGGTEL